MTSTIFALATPPGRSAVAVVRISGPFTRLALEALCGGSPPPPRRASLRPLRQPMTGDILDHALVIWFPEPHSFTGEDQAELHLHGGPAVVSSVLSALATVGLVPAEPGAFTRRAFEHGKLDLIQAEAIADLIEAETQAQQRQALNHLGGTASDRQAAWRDALLDIAASLEASIDFPDEDLPDTLPAQAREQLESLQTELTGALSDVRGEQVRDGYHVALIGQPNAGKSSLFNALTGRDAAIVTDIPGTTRDVIEAPIVMAGYRVVLADTAGLRQANDVIEAEGVRRAQDWAAMADLRLLVVDQGSDTEADFALMRAGDILVLNKSDLAPSQSAQVASLESNRRGVRVVTATARNTEVAALQSALTNSVSAALTGAEPPVVTRLRQRELLNVALQHLLQALGPARGVELVAEDVRLAARALERIVGKMDTEQVLERVFSSFCIGK